MHRKTIIALMFFCLIGLSQGCSEKSTDIVRNSTGDYEGLVDAGWEYFATGDWQRALRQFESAQGIPLSDASAYAGAGWSRLFLGQIARAISDFEDGRSAGGPAADLYAGWAFALNATKEYSDSNERIDDALAADPAWDFGHGISLDTDDLIVMKAENHALLGNFALSLAAVRILNPGFSANVSTPDGQAALVIEIERLKSLI